MVRVLRRAASFAIVAAIVWLAVVGCSKSLPGGSSIPTGIPGSNLGHL
jgi:hypothetical protein